MMAPKAPPNTIMPAVTGARASCAAFDEHAAEDHAQRDTGPRRLVKSIENNSGKEATLSAERV